MGFVYLSISINIFLRSKDKVAALEEKFRNMKAGGGSTQERIQQLQKENTSLQSALAQKSTEFVFGLYFKCVLSFKRWWEYVLVLKIT